MSDYVGLLLTWKVKELDPHSRYYIVLREFRVPMNLNPSESYCFYSVQQFLLENAVIYVPKVDLKKK